MVSAFLLLAITLAVSVWFVVHSARKVSQVSQTEAMMTKQRRAIGNLYTQLLDAETQAENATLQYADNSALKCYLKASAQVDTALSTLKNTVTDSLQMHRIDSLQALTWLKRDGIVRLVNALRTENHRGNNLQQQIDALHKSRRPVTMQVKVPVVERGEQVVIERRKRGFFRRLADVFKRAKDDTIRSALVQHETTNDTTRAQVNIADTLAHLLTDVHHDLQRESLAHTRSVYSQSDQLRATSTLLSQRMTALIEHFTTTQQQLINQAIHNEREQRQLAAFKLAAMAVLAIVLSGALVLWLWFDMRRANRYRKAIEQAKERTEKLMEQREQLLLTISHDIKAPVNTILGYMHLLPHAVMEQHKELRAVETSAQHLLQLVMALLDFHQLEAGAVVAQMAPTHINSLLQSVADAFLPLAQQKGLQLKVNLQHLPTPLWATTDTLRLHQIVDNLMSNAIKYTVQGEVSLIAEWNAASSQLQLKVTDTGCGMTQVDLDRIFSPFTRVKGSEEQEGSGLGLSITHKLVELLGGTLIAHSELGQGSKFVLTLPLKLCSQPTALTPTKEVGEVTIYTQKVCCAVLDDDVLQLQLTEAMLHNVLPNDAEINTFHQADELFKWIDKGNHPTWVMTDIEMPTTSGYEVLAALRKRSHLKQIPIVAMTSHLLVPISDFKQRGFADVLFKPFTQNDLLHLQQHLNALSTTKGEGNHAMAKKSAAPSNCSFDALFAFAEGDVQAENAIRNQFATDCRKHLQILEQALLKHDKATICRIAHKMLPTFTLIGSPILLTLQTLEAQRDATAWHDNDALLCRQVIEELKRVIDLLS